jgi:inosine/xanthosine triphosphatase
MKRIVIASHNPVKVEATVNGFQRMFPAESFTAETVSVTSGVVDQPDSDVMTLQGAFNRAQNAAKVRPAADYWVGLEGGVAEIYGEMAAFAWIVVKSSQITGRGRTGTFFLPDCLAELVRRGEELGQADDIVFNRSGSKREEGAIGLLTGNAIDRTGLYEHAVLLALVPFKNRKLFAVKTRH